MKKGGDLTDSTQPGRASSTTGAASSCRRWRSWCRPSETRSRRDGFLSGLGSVCFSGHRLVVFPSNVVGINRKTLGFDRSLVSFWFKFDFHSMRWVFLGDEMGLTEATFPTGFKRNACFDLTAIGLDL